MSLSMPELTPKVVLGVAAHPDDLDFCAAGSMAKWAATGAKTYYLVLTDGSKGAAAPKLEPTGLSAIRQGEQRAAGKIIGLTDIFFADFEDGQLENTKDVKREITRRIRQLKPDVVVAWDPTFVYSVSGGFINHSDHRAAGQATLDAVYPLARNHLSHPELLAEGYDPHKVTTVLMMRADEANYISDISGYLELKLSALLAHGSQFAPGCDEVALVKSRALELGRDHGLAAAEGFVRVDVRF